MKFNDIERIVDDIPYINKSNARFIYDFIITNKIQNILELGIAHGTATCYMAGALDELKIGSISAVDLESVSEHFKPSCEDQIKSCNLEKYVQIYRMKTGYNWFLHDEIKRNTINNICTEKYDLCIIDGPKNWTIDSSAFFLVDKLLKKGGYIIFDDFEWTYNEANTRRESTDGIIHDSLSKEELTLPHVKEIFELLVKQHPNYSNFKVFHDRQWVMAKKTNVDIKVELLNYKPFDYEEKLFLSNKISNLYSQILELKNNKLKYIIYGYGSFGQILNSFLEKQNLGFIDINYKEINNISVYSFEDGLKKDFDFILISTLGRENEVLNNLMSNFSIPINKIILFNETFDLVEKNNI